MRYQWALTTHLTRSYSAQRLFFPISTTQVPRCLPLRACCGKLAGRRIFGQIRFPPFASSDPDGDLVDYLAAAGHARPHGSWACYHTHLTAFVHEKIEYGIIGRVVGASFA